MFVCLFIHLIDGYKYNEKGKTEKGIAAGRKHAQLCCSTIVPLLVSVVVGNHSLPVWWHQPICRHFYNTPSVFTSTRIPFSICCTFYDDNGTLVPHRLGPNVPKIGHKYCCVLFFFSSHEHLKKQMEIFVAKIKNFPKCVYRELLWVMTNMYRGFIWKVKIMT